MVVIFAVGTPRSSSALPSCALRDIAATSIVEHFKDRVTLFLQCPLSGFSRRPTWSQFRPLQHLGDTVLLTQGLLRMERQ